MSLSTPSNAYINIAYLLLPGAQVLGAAKPIPPVPFAMICAHLLECTLKAFLSRYGDDSKLKKRGIRHNLTKLWEMAKADGLQISNSPPQWVKELSILHDTPYYLRYSTGINVLVFPKLDLLFSELTDLLDKVHSELRRT